MLTVYFFLSDYEIGEYIQGDTTTSTYSGVFPKSCDRFQVNSFSVMQTKYIVLICDSHLLDSIPPKTNEWKCSSIFRVNLLELHFFCKLIYLALSFQLPTKPSWKIRYNTATGFASSNDLNLNFFCILWSLLKPMVSCSYSILGGRLVPEQTKRDSSQRHYFIWCLWLGCWIPWRSFRFDYVQQWTWQFSKRYFFVSIEDAVQILVAWCLKLMISPCVVKLNF